MVKTSDPLMLLETVETAEDIEERLAIRRRASDGHSTRFRCPGCHQVYVGVRVQSRHREACRKAIAWLAQFKKRLPDSRTAMAERRSQGDPDGQRRKCNFNYRHH
jgi:hypothetical protein